MAKVKGMEAIILAGGLGTRLRSLVHDRPKALAPVNGEPFLQMQLRLLAKAGFSRVILATGYLGEMMRKHIGGAFAGMVMEYSHEDSPLGTGGALAKALGKCKDDHVIVMNGDTWLDVDFGALQAFWKEKGGIVLTGVYMRDASRYGKLELEGDRILGLLEKGSSEAGWINAGCYVFPTNLFDDYEMPAVFSLEKDFLRKRLREKPATLFRCAGDFWDIGTPADYTGFAAHIASLPVRAG